MAAASSISHKMEEIFQLAATKSPFCATGSGLLPSRWKAGYGQDHRHDGRALAKPALPGQAERTGEVILDVQHLTSLRQPSIRDVSFQLRKGKSSVSPGWWAPSVPISLKRCFGVREKSSGPLPCTVRKSTTIAPTKRLITVCACYRRTPLNRYLCLP